jgi:ribonuclease J
MRMGPQITFHGGIGTIGGTKIMVQEGEHRVLLDFGLAFGPGADFWGGRILPRGGVGRLRDLLALGQVPAVNGLYRPTDLPGLGLSPGQADQTQVFISHLHLDHMAVVDLLADSTAVWMHHDSLRLFQAVTTVGEQPPLPAGACGFAWGQPIPLGPMQVTPLAVDHDIPGAAGFLVETSAGTVVYTGDLRLHGAHPDLTEAFVRAAAATRPKMLLIEGTRISESTAPHPRLHEAEVPPRIAALLQETEGLGMITLYPRNTERIHRIAQMSRSVGRRLLLSPETAHIYAAMGGDLTEIALYQRLRDRQALETGTADPWLRGLLTSGVPVVGAEEVFAAQQEYLLQLLYWDVNELIDLRPCPGSVFIHSNGEPLGRYDPAFDLFVRWLDHFGIPLRFVPSTGHASAADLATMAQTISPQWLVPVHCREPERFAVEGLERLLPEPGATYDIATGRRTG